MMSSKCDICSGQHLTKDHEKATGQSMSNELKAIRQALARGYCTEENETKEVDSELIEAMTTEIMELSRPTEPKTKQIYWAYIRDNTAWFHKVKDDGKVMTQKYLVETDTDEVILAFMVDVKDCLNLHLTEEPQQVLLSICDEVEK